MTKILLVANTDWYLYNFRLSLAKFLRDQGFEVALVSPGGRFAPLMLDSGFRWIEWDLGRQTLAPWKEMLGIIHLARIYRQEQVDLVHHFTVKPVLYGSLAARLLGVKNLVNSVTGLGFVFLSQDIKAQLLRGFVKRFYRVAFGHPNCAIIFENESDRQYLRKEKVINTQSTWLIQGVGIDPFYFSPLPEPAGKPVIVLPARLLWDKGVGVLVDAARLLRQKVDVRVALVGEPDAGNPATVTSSTIQGWVQEGIIEWWGWQTDMRNVYTNCHVVTLPSFGEGVPTVLLEAAACARPIVTTDVAGCRDVVENGVNGLLVPPNDAPALAVALGKLIDDPALRIRMGAMGRQRVLEKFTNAHINAATLEVYRALLERGNKGSNHPA
jgi:glycosyltransferase involved in cell wall biosynthesis